MTQPSTSPFYRPSAWEDVTPAPVSDATRLTRVRVFPPSSFDNLREMIGDSSFTGTVHIDCNQGGIAGVRFVEETKVDFDAK